MHFLILRSFNQVSRKCHNVIKIQVSPLSVVMPDPYVVTLTEVNHSNAVSFLTVRGGVGTAQHVSVSHHLQVNHVRRRRISLRGKNKLIVPGNWSLEETEVCVISAPNVCVCIFERYNLMRTHLRVTPLQQRMEGYWICKTWRSIIIKKDNSVIIKLRLCQAIC